MVVVWTEIGCMKCIWIGGKCWSGGHTGGYVDKSIDGFAINASKEVASQLERKNLHCHY